MRILLVLLVSLVNTSFLFGVEPVSFEKRLDGVDIFVGDLHVAEYVHSDAANSASTPTRTGVGRPFISNVQTLDGIQVTRNYPVKQGDQNDHPHHQGIFHTFSQVNGTDYWHMRGKTKHVRFVRDPQVGTKTGFVVENAYLAANEKTVVLKELISYEFVVTKRGLLIAVDAVIESKQDEVILGSKEEGGLAVRMSSDLRVESGATMIDNQGRSGGSEIWGKAAVWVDNSGMKKGRWVGITVMTHPANGRLYHWHARDYGLLATNPLGPLNAAPDKILSRGESMRFRYGVMIHSSTQRNQYKPADAQADYERFTSMKIK